MYYTIFAKREENFLAKIDVAPLAGARIEIGCPSLSKLPSGSLPSRERGLKFFSIANNTPSTSSLPSRERGLKFRRCTGLFRSSASLPSRERGLK